MQIAQVLGGYSLGQADLLRRAMGKKLPEEMEKQREIFVGGCAKNAISNEIANSLFDMMVQFAEYCFNKSHSQAYAVVTYQTAYLKTHYPVEYMSAVLSSVSSDQEKVQGYIAECQAMNIDILPPDVSVSDSDFTPDGNAIRFGLTAIKGLGEGAVQTIVSERANGPYTTMKDFLDRIDLKVVNKKALESLIKSGATVGLGMSRKQALANLDSLVDAANRRQNEKNTGQISLFSFGQSQGISLETPLIGDASEFTEGDLQTMEHELLGFYVTSHPLKRVANRLRYLTTHSVKEMKEAPDGTTVIMGGLANSIEKKLTKQNKLLCIIHLEDLTGKCEVVMYSEALEKVSSDVLLPQSLLLIKGKVKKNEDNTSVMGASIRRISDAAMVDVVFNQHQSFSDLHRLKDLLILHKGEDPVMLHFPQGKKSQAILVGAQFWVDARSSLPAAIETNFAESVKVRVHRLRI
jgi:DNA polymerase-3 subunit alpha